MIEFTFLVLLALSIFLLCFCMLSSQQISKKTSNYFLIFIATIVIVFSLIFKPDSFIRWDLIEHFKLVDNMRIGGWKYATTEGEYASLFIYNTFAYLISLLPKSCQNLLSTIPLIIDFMIVGYIYKDMFNKLLQNKNEKAKALSLFLWICTFGLKLAISGIRCSLAVSIAALAIYLELIQRKKKTVSIFLYFMSIFIHNFAIVIILVRLLTAIKKPVLIMILSLGTSLTLQPFAIFMVKNVNNEYLNFSFSRILNTFEEMSFSSALQSFNGSTLLIYLCFVILSVYLFIISTKTKNKCKDNKHCQAITNFASTVGAVAIGLSFNYLYLERFMYLVSYAFLMITPLHNRNKNRINIENIFLIPIALFVFFFNDVYIFMVNYIGTYFLSF